MRNKILYEQKYWKSEHVRPNPLTLIAALRATKSSPCTQSITRGSVGVALVAALYIVTPDTVYAEDAYGSITFEQLKNGNWASGMSWGFSNRSDALSRAQAECRNQGARNCVEVLWFRNACGSLAVGGGNGYGTGWGNTGAIAEDYAMRACRDHNSNCQIIQTECSF